MRTLRTIIIGMSSMTFLFALSYENKVDLAHNWNTNKSLVITKYKEQHTNKETGEYDAEGDIRSQQITDSSYVPTVNIEKRNYPSYSRRWKNVKN